MKKEQRQKRQNTEQRIPKKSHIKLKKATRTRLGVSISEALFVYFSFGIHVEIGLCVQRMLPHEFMKSIRLKTDEHTHTHTNTHHRWLTVNFPSTAFLLVVSKRPLVQSRRNQKGNVLHSDTGLFTWSLGQGRASANYR